MVYQTLISLLKLKVINLNETENFSESYAIVIIMYLTFLYFFFRTTEITNSCTLQHIKNSLGDASKEYRERQIF